MFSCCTCTYLIFGVGLEGEEDVGPKLYVVLLGDGEGLQPPGTPAPTLHQSEVTRWSRDQLSANHR